MHQEFIASERTGLLQAPGLRRRQCLWEWSLRLHQPVEGSTQKPGTQGQLQFINRILSEQ